MQLIYVLVIACGMPTCKGGEPFTQMFETSASCDAALAAFQRRYPGFMYTARCVATQAYKPLK